MSRAVFLDRDGTINLDPGYISDPEIFELLPGAAEGLLRMREMGFLLFVVSNQSGVGRGYFSLSDLDRVNGRMEELLSAAGVRLDGICCCLHRPNEKCACRKPETGLIKDILAKHHDIELGRSFFVGDKQTDIMTGQRCGCHTVLVEHRPERVQSFSHKPDFVAADLVEAAAIIAGCV